MKKVFVTILVALFATVVFAGTPTKTSVKPAELPKCIAEWVKVNMKGFVVDKAYRIDDKSVDPAIVYYYFRVSKDRNFQWVYVGKTCRDFRKISQANAETDPPVPYPPIPVQPEKAKDAKPEQK